MLKTRKLLLSLLCMGLIAGEAPAQVSTAKPWTYWWWMGSAVNKKDILKELTQLKRVGIGGVHIVPIYGVKGAEKDFVGYLSDQWVSLLDYTLREAKALNLGVDMTTGTGWPFGGPNVTPEMEAKKYRLENGIPRQVATGQQVKRAAPGGEGRVVDPFSKIAMARYLERFDSALAKMKLQPRAMYCDSYEIYGANWTDDFLSAFKRRRGYDLLSQWKKFTDTSSSEAGQLVRMDYHETMNELLVERYVDEWTGWCRSHRLLSRYQAHGSPGNLLDLYAAADIPETEVFGSSRFHIPLLRVDPDFPVETSGKPSPLVMKFASSAAHLTGKKLVSSETGTWLADHFRVSLSQLKPEIDQLFTAGINHIFFHGTAYSPSDVPYPGWLFYASTNFAPSSGFYDQLPLLNGYIERCQDILQNSKPDNDVLVYFPISDIWSGPSFSDGGTDQLAVHTYSRWLTPTPFGAVAQRLRDGGFTFDYVSDRQLENINFSDGKLSTDGGSYRVLLVPSCKYIPIRTMERFVKMAQAGVRIVFAGNLPGQPAGFYRHHERMASFSALKAKIQTYPAVSVTSQYEKTLPGDGASPDSGLADHGLSFVRRIYHGKPVYFIANLNNRFRGGWVTVNLDGTSVEKYDPLNNERHLIPVRRLGSRTEIYLELLAGSSCFLTTGGESRRVNPPGAFHVQVLNPKWQLTLSEGRPSSYHRTFGLDTLRTWTSLSDSAAYFSGTGVYTASVFVADSIARAGEVVVDLGNVCESATVRINDRLIGTAWSIPYRLHVPEGVLKAGSNQLTVGVTNLPANYMRLYSQQHPGWPSFFFVDINYKPFDAKHWKAMPSGLTSPVRILYR